MERTQNKAEVEVEIKVEVKVKIKNGIKIVLKKFAVDHYHT